MTKFVLTEHAKQRIDERFGTKPHKWEKLARKVWEKGSLLPDWWKNHQTKKGYYLYYRLFQGFVFVYDVQDVYSGVNIVLITVQKYNPDKVKIHYEL